jgi:diguanylate cyclase (GGDEF)-like protein
VEGLLALLLVALVGNLVVLGVIVIPFLHSPVGASTASATGVDLDGRLAAAAVTGRLDGDPAEDGSTRAYDRVVRVTSWIFILVTAIIVLTIGGTLWPETQQAILILLAFAGMFLILVNELLPSNALGSAKFIVEGSVGLTGAAMLVALTGGVASPFFFTFPLIVAGAALIVSQSVTIGLLAIATIGYLLAVALGTAAGLSTVELPQVLAVVVVNLTALFLLAYVATVIAREQRRARDAAIRMSAVDPLTGLFNRSFFFAAIEREIARCARSGRGFCLLMMDLDELKAVNDRLGHFYGDRVLRGVGDVVSAGVRRIDTAARYGGDEFVVLLPETDPTGAFVLAEKIRIGVEEMVVGLPPTGPQPSLSVGVVAFPDDGATADELMISADEAMYASKRAGKNRVTGVSVPRVLIESGVASRV